MTEDATPLEHQVNTVHEHLSATAELPVERDASRWLGEAEAVASDAAAGDLEAETIRKRIGQVDRLLSEVDGTGHEEADDHVEAARRICREILEER
ncbi:hypothetical protein [Natrialba swarupiae]|uniref:DUF8152 domain-containing protein n=1 Tax=Natrialba swarupiae TaxID=2448032 RepID=A0A5D5ALU9_9EURY|nr:hypothetical protein [Natrialba swarupiae]TYT62818.1 hypothetical protein FYC77_05725 [Natrialba swarupiae]